MESLAHVTEGVSGAAEDVVAELTRLEDELGVDCTLEDVFDTTSLSELAALLARRADAAADRQRRGR